jgi:hypothetical protein
MHLLAGHEALFDVAVVRADAPQGVAADAARPRVPDIAPGFDEISALGVDHALGGTVVQGEQMVAVAAVGPPPAAVRGSLFDLVAIPDAGEIAERGENRRSGQQASAAVQFDVALRRGTDAGDGRIGQPPGAAAEMQGAVQPGE